MTAFLRGERPLASYLIAFAVALVLPLLVYAAVVTLMFARAERAQLERTAHAGGDIVLHEFEQEIARHIGLLRALATSPAIKTGDSSEFRRQAMQLAAWSDAAYSLRDVTGNLLVSSAALPRPFAGPPELKELEEGAITTSNLAISDRIQDVVTGGTHLAIAIPISIGTEVKYVLTATLPSAAISNLIGRHMPPESTVIAICDRNGIVIRRSDHRFEGQKLPGFPELTEGEGTWIGTGFGGRKVNGFYVRSAATGYVVATGVAASALDAPLLRSLAVLAALGAALIALGFLAAISVSRTIADTFRRLTSLADDLARGVPSSVSEPFAVSEAAALANALTRSAEAVCDRDEQLARANEELERRVAERAAEAEAKSRLLTMTLDAMEQGLLMVDENGVVALGNRRAIELLDLNPGFLTSRPHFTAFRRAIGERYECAWSGPRFEEWLASGELEPFERVYERVLPNGTVLEIRGVPTPTGGVVRTYTDITARRLAETALREKTAILDATLENMGQGLITIGSEGVVQVCNERAIRLLDLPADLMRSRPAFRDVLNAHLAENEFAKSDPCLIEWVAQGGLEVHAHVYERERPNGVHVEIRTIPMAKVVRCELTQTSRIASTAKRRWLRARPSFASARSGWRMPSIPEPMVCGTGTRTLGRSGYRTPGTRCLGTRLVSLPAI